MSRRAFYLVQRMTARLGTGRGFDRFFELDYMGASEFEWGALPKSLERIRTGGALCVQAVPVTAEGTRATAYIVGPKVQVALAAEAMQAWIDGGCRGHELSYFAENACGWADEFQRRTNAWWSISDDVMFALDEETAQQLRDAIEAKS